MASIQKTVLVYIGTFITGSASTAEFDVVAKVVFKSPVNPHIKGKSRVGI